MFRNTDYIWFCVVRIITINSKENIMAKHFIARTSDKKGRVFVHSTIYQASCRPFSVVTLAVEKKRVFQSFPDGRLKHLFPDEVSAGI